MSIFVFQVCHSRHFFTSHLCPFVFLLSVCSFFIFVFKTTSLCWLWPICCGRSVQWPWQDVRPVRHHCPPAKRKQWGDVEDISALQWLPWLSHEDHWAGNQSHENLYRCMFLSFNNQWLYDCSTKKKWNLKRESPHSSHTASFYFKSLYGSALGLRES